MLKDGVTATRDVDILFLLSAPANVLVERLTTRTNNPYGRHPYDLAEVLDTLRQSSRVCGGALGTR